jgi:hypothetical protein
VVVPVGELERDTLDLVRGGFFVDDVRHDDRDW